MSHGEVCLLQPARRQRLRRTALFAAVLMVAAAVTASLAPAEVAAVPASKVYLNGRPAPVYFNDGDSFRVLAGPLAETKARLSGFNTLESYGAVHRWGGWTAKELYRNAKMATMNARRGEWRCTSDLKRDGYGRILWWCPDLAEDQVRKGLAHVMTVTAEGGDPRLVRAQRLAQQERLGMWAHGIPDYILTSTHSNDEGYAGTTYNRLVSTRDGHSVKWKHVDNYAECQEICSKTKRYDEARLRAAIATLRGESAIAGFVGRYSDGQLLDMIRAKAAGERLTGVLDESHRAPLQGALERLASAGSLGETTEMVDSCMVYAPFNRRYGARSASCLH